MTGAVGGGSGICVGLMSGTSLDGISGAVVRFRRRPPADDGPPFAGELLATDTRPYSESQRARLERALAEPMSAVEWCRLDADLGSWLADAAVAVIAQAGVARAEIEAIGSHGQTVWHEPGHSTWQIGEAAVIAERTGRPVVSDLRARDVAAGGQGAPLVSIADALLFSRAGAWRALQNLGGIGNVTVVPPAAARATATAASDAAAVPSLEGVRAFDTGPGVVVIDAVVRALRPGARYDEDGALARAGHVIPGVVPALLAAPYFAAMPPKSTGREQFSASYVADFMARCREARPDASDADLVATAVALTAGSIADAVRRFVLEPIGDLLLSGGGARNPALVDAITASLAPLAVRRFDREFFDGEAKEAVAFALLAYLHVRGLPGNVPSATGARGPRVLGVWTPA